jgi:hypothetical protein
MREFGEFDVNMRRRSVLALGAAGLLGINSTACGGTAGRNLANVRDPTFAGGAKGDGTTDDTEAFTAALASSNQVYVPPGRYVITKSSRRQFNNIVFDETRIFGDGQASVIVNGFDYSAVAGQAKAGDEYYNAFQATGISGITLENLAFERTCALSAFLCSDVVIKNIYINGFHDGTMQDKGVYFYNCARVTVSRSAFRNTNFSVYLSGNAAHRSSQCIVEANSFENNIAAGAFSYAKFPVGVYIHYVDDVAVSGNTFRNIYSSFDNGTTGTGMGYGVYDGDGAAGKIMVRGNAFEYTGNGSKNATAVYISQAVFAAISNNAIKASARAQLVNGLLIDSKISRTARVVSGNTLSSGQAGFPTYSIYITGASAANEGTYSVSQNTITGFSNAVRVDGLGAGKFLIADNICESQTSAGIRMEGLPATPLKRIEILRNTIKNGQAQGILFGAYCVSPAIVGNTVLDGNMANGAGEEFAAIRFETFSFGSTITGNLIGNSAGGSGSFSFGVANASDVSNRIFKDITANNSFVGLPSNNMSFLRFPVSRPTVGIFDIESGDFVQNTQSGAMAGGWTCIHTAALRLTADASSGSMTIAVASTAGILAGDSVLLSKDGTPYDGKYYTASNWHATTVAAVTDPTHLTITKALSAAYTTGTAVVKTARFSP